MRRVLATLLLLASSTAAAAGPVSLQVDWREYALDGAKPGAKATGIFTFQSGVFAHSADEQVLPLPTPQVLALTLRYDPDGRGKTLRTYGLSDFSQVFFRTYVQIDLQRSLAYQFDYFGLSSTGNVAPYSLGDRIIGYTEGPGLRITNIRLIAPVPVAEPSGLALIAGMVGLLGWRRARRLG